MLLRSGLAVWIAWAALAAAAWAEGTILTARFTEPTQRYDHGILGDDIEWGALALELDTCPQCALMTRRTRLIRLPRTRVFEDIAPRVVDLDNDGSREVIVVETDIPRGARLSVYGPEGLIAATPHIGRTHRWLAPVGAGDLDGDGKVEIAYVDRPHLAKVLRIWRFEAGGLRHIADMQGLTNHQIGWDFIPGGIRDCGQGAEMITADAGWSRIMATRFDGKGMHTRAIAPYTDAKSFAPVMRCRK